MGEALMTIAEVEASARQAPAAYERARRRQMGPTKTRDAAVAYLVPGQARSYRSRTERPEEHPYGPEWPVAVPAYRFARGQLARLTTEHLEAGLEKPSDIAYHRMLHVLRSVLSEDSVYPTMSIDQDGGVIAEWHIAHYALEVDVAPDGGFVYTVRQKGKRVGGGTSQTPLRKVIRDVSTMVAHLNPNWRSLFQHGSAPVSR
jgi:hypothetical protein